MEHISKVIDYMNPGISLELPKVEIPVIKASNDNLKGYGFLVDDPTECEVEIVQWPAISHRQIDNGTGDQAGTVEGEFRFWWEDNALYGENGAVGDTYLLGLSEGSIANNDRAPYDILLWHANYHPDGGQLFYPKTKDPFIIPLALPGDDLAPTDFVGFYIEKGGIYIHPNVWHEAVFSLAHTSNFYDKQGKVHARVSCNFIEEFGVLLKLPLKI